MTSKRRVRPVRRDRSPWLYFLLGMIIGAVLFGAGMLGALYHVMK
jgi:hypothetical protein